MTVGLVEQIGLLVMFNLGWAGIIWLLVDAAEWVRDRWGRVPVIDATWYLIRDAIEWMLHLPGRAIRWARPRDTPRGLGGT